MLTNIIELAETMDRERSATHAVTRVEAFMLRECWCETDGLYILLTPTAETH